MFDKLVDLLVTWIRLLFICCTIQQFQAGCILRWGKYHRTIGPGLHFHWPLNVEVVSRVSVVPETTLIGPQSLTTKDDKSVVVAVVVTYEIDDVVKFLLEVETAHDVIHDATCGVVSDFVMKHTWSQLVDAADMPDDERVRDIDNKITIAVRRRAKKYGVGIMSVQFVDMVKCRSYRLVQNHVAHL